MAENGVLSQKVGQGRSKPYGKMTGLKSRPKVGYRPFSTRVWLSTFCILPDNWLAKKCSTANYKGQAITVLIQHNKRSF